MSAGRRRPDWPAYPLTALVPGLGHGYLGRWRRGVLWFVVYAVAIAFLSAQSLTAAFDPEAPFVLTALGFEEVTFANVAFPLAVIVICLLDVYAHLLAARAADSRDHDRRGNGGADGRGGADGGSRS